MRHLVASAVAAARRSACAIAVAAACIGWIQSLEPRAWAAGQTPALSDEARAAFTAAWRQQPRLDVDVPADGAQVVIVKFNDFECPGCRDAEAAYRPVLESFAQTHPGAVRYVVKDWPWDATCNFNASATIPGHEASCEAAAAARMARDRGAEAYETMVDWLYANQGATPEAVEEAARRQLGVTDFAAELALKLPEIQRDIADGGVLGVRSTPTYFVNGVQMPSGVVPPEYLSLAISLELSATP